MTKIDIDFKAPLQDGCEYIYTLEMLKEEAAYLRIPLEQMRELNEKGLIRSDWLLWTMG